MFGITAFAEFVPGGMIASVTWDVPPSGSAHYNGGINLTAASNIPDSCTLQFSVSIQGGAFSAFADVSLPQNMQVPGVYVTGATVDVNLQLHGKHSGGTSALGAYHWISA